jgi:hypothetical protein
MNKLIAMIVTLSALLFSPNLEAAKVLSCEGCSATQYRNMARNSAPNSAGQYPVYVADAQNNQLNHFSVYVEVEQGFVSKFPIVRSNEPHVKALFDDYVAAKRDAEQAYDHGFFVLHYPEGSAYNIRGGGNRQFETAISDFIWNDANVFSNIGMYIGTGYALFGNLIDIDIYIEIGFDDGSTLQMKIVGFTSDNKVKFKYRQGSAESVDGNAIPDTQGGFSNHGGIYLSKNKLNDFIRYAASMGVPVTTSGSGGGSYTVTCRIESGRVICVARRNK